MHILKFFLKEECSCFSLTTFERFFLLCFFLLLAIHVECDFFSNCNTNLTVGGLQNETLTLSKVQRIFIQKFRTDTLDSKYFPAEYLTFSLTFLHLDYLLVLKTNVLTEFMPQRYDFIIGVDLSISPVGCAVSSNSVSVFQYLHEIFS